MVKRYYVKVVGEWDGVVEATDEGDAQEIAIETFAAKYEVEVDVEEIQDED
jgi:hypothetical protein